MYTLTCLNRLNTKVQCTPLSEYFFQSKYCSISREYIRKVFPLMPVVDCKPYNEVNIVVPRLRSTCFLQFTVVLYVMFYFFLTFEGGGKKYGFLYSKALTTRHNFSIGRV